MQPESEEAFNSPSRMVTTAMGSTAAPKARTRPPMITPNNRGGGVGNKITPNASDPRYRKPFDLGWKREVVYRATTQLPNSDVVRKHSDKGEVYYISPAGRKCRTKLDIISQLLPDGGLDVNDFLFIREGLGMGPDEETVRVAKPQTPNHRRPVNFLDLGEPDPTLGFGKRVPKPKMPKGASPPPSKQQRGVSEVYI